MAYAPTLQNPQIESNESLLQRNRNPSVKEPQENADSVQMMSSFRMVRSKPMRGFQIHVAGATALVLSVSTGAVLVGPVRRADAVSVRRVAVVAKRSRPPRPPMVPTSIPVVVTPGTVPPTSNGIPLEAPATLIETTPVVPPTIAPGIGAPADALAMLEMVNSARASQGLGPLVWDDRLGQYGLEWSQDMSVNGFRHRNLSTLNQGPGVATGENIAWGSGVDVQRLHQLLLDSPGHRANIMSTRYKRIGVGIYRSGNAMWITQEFGS
jgi:uncharacterized protein YkwD